MGLLALVGIAWLASRNRRRFPLRIVVVGIALQLALGVVLLRTIAGRAVFGAMNDTVAAIVAYTNAGVRFVFGPLVDVGFSFALGVLPVIVFMGSLFSMLYHLGVVQVVVRALARFLSRTLGTSGAESLSTVAEVFLGMTEAPLLVRPYIAKMTESELFTLMVAGMATVAGSVLVAYAQMLGGGDFGGHLLTASLLAAPGAIVISKVMIPETGTPETLGREGAMVPRTTVNLIDAAAEGGIAGLKLAATVGALLIAFVALVALANDAVSFVGGLFGAPDLTLQAILGWLLAPLALAMGIPWDEARQVGALLGLKTVLNEFLAYQALGELVRQHGISARSATITAYALCGFANFGSIAILIGGVGSMAPTRRSDLARLGLRAILAGTLATCMAACIASLLLP
ncbi:MAG TPA: nucleoside transporter C-terminal domain-containing protein [Myxococcota bacterium]|nr:nucleoside transporter C-terminal domain-containing protein [Myxococcota bacterium]